MLQALGISFQYRVLTLNNVKPIVECGKYNVGEKTLIALKRIYNIGSAENQPCLSE